MNSWMVVTCLTILAAFSVGANANAQQVIRELPMVFETGGHTGQVRGIAFADGGHRIVTLSDDRTARIWDAATGRALRTVYLPLSREGLLPVSAIAPDGSYVVSAGAGPDGKDAIVYISIVGKEVIYIPTDRARDIVSFQFAGIGKQLVAIRRDVSALVGVPGGPLRELELEGGPPVAVVALSPDERYLVGRVPDRTARLWMLESGKQVSHPISTAKEMSSTAFSLDGKLLASLDSDKLNVWTLEGKTVRTVSTFGKLVGPIRFSGDSKSLYIGGIGLTRISIVPEDEREEGEREIVEFTHERVTALATSPWIQERESQLIATTDSHGQLFVWDPKGERRGPYGSSTQEILRVEWLPKGHRLLWSNAPESPLLFSLPELQLRVPTEEERSSIQNKNRSGEIELSRRVGGTVVLKQANGKEKPLSPPKSTYPPTCFSLAGEGRAALGSSDGQIYIVDLESGENTLVLRGHTGAVRDMAPSPDGRYLVSGGDDRTIKVWNLVGRGEGRPLLHLLPVGGKWIAWTPEGYFAASAGGDRLVAWMIPRDQPGSWAKLFLDQIQHQFFRPHVIAELLESETVAAAVHHLNETQLDKSPVLDVRMLEDDPKSAAAPKVPPEVHLVKPSSHSKPTSDKTISVTAKIVPRSSVRVTSVCFQVNGRIQSIVNFDPQQPEVTREVPLLYGRNVVSVVAFDANEDFGRSETAEVFLVAEEGLQPKNVEPVVPKSKPTGSGDLYVVAVGISRYKDATMNLLFAHRDAIAFEEMALEQEGGLYDNVFSTLILDDCATRGKILGALTWAKKAKFADTVMILLSAHGRRDEKLNYYLAPHDYNTMNVADSLLWADIVVAVELLKANRVILFVDTCHGAGVAGPDTAAKNPYRDLLSQKVGAILYASSEPEQQSYESKLWKHGAFTKAVLDTIADRTSEMPPPDGFVCASELVTNIGRRVRALTNGSQEPVFPSGLGNDPELFRVMPP